MKELKVKISKAPEIKVQISGARGDVGDGVYAPNLHNHTISEVDGLQAALNAKASLNHSHTINQITDFESGVNSVVDDAINEHKNEADPHTQYLKENDAATNYAAKNHTHGDIYYTNVQVDNLLAGKSNVGHTHNDIYYTETEINNLLANKSNTGHYHDDRYYTQLEIDSLLFNKSDSNHSHAGMYAPLNHSHGDIYYTETEVNNLLANKSNTGHTHSYLNLTDKPTIPSNINDLADVNTSSLVVGQVLKWNGSAWVNGTDNNSGGGSGGAAVEDQIIDGVIDIAPSQNAVFDALALKANLSALDSKSDITHEHALNDLSNVSITSLAVGDMIQWNGSAWVNIPTPTGGGSGGSSGLMQDFFAASPGQGDFTLTEEVTGSAVVTLNGLQQYPFIDYTITGSTLSFAYTLEGGDEVVITYGGSGGSSGGGGATTLDGLTDVVINTPVSGQVLKYNGTEWVNGTDNSSSGGEDPAMTTFGDLTVVNREVGASPGNTLFTIKGGTWWYPGKNVDSASSYQIPDYLSNSDLMYLSPNSIYYVYLDYYNGRITTYSGAYIPLNTNGLLLYVIHTGPTEISKIVDYRGFTITMRNKTLLFATQYYTAGRQYEFNAAEYYYFNQVADASVMPAVNGLYPRFIRPYLSLLCLSAEKGYNEGEEADYITGDGILMGKPLRMQNNGTVKAFFGDTTKIWNSSTEAWESPTQANWAVVLKLELEHHN